ncbi:MAG: acetate uptake transporter [Streptosporangiales bacterium]|nr:acetate uptake transporter [Streptosporangiales bacterium]MBO0892496.1 acetate uptake transporter [Acidothermales bacterium]
MASTHPQQETEAATTPAPQWARGALLADPGPVGLAAFAATTFFLSVVNAGLLPATIEPGVLGLALFYGGVVQVLAGMWEFAKGNTFGALAFSSYGGFWLSFWYLLTHVNTAAMGPNAGKAVGLYLLCWTIFTGYLAIASLRTTGAIAATVILLFLTFLALTIGELGGSAMFGKIGGWLGIVTAIVAWYTSFAGVTNATFGKTVLPVLARR